MKKSYAMLAVLLVSGCASSQAELQRATASSIGGGTPPDSVVVANVDRGFSAVSWTAEARGRSYTCSADDMVRRPYCYSR